MYQDYVKIREQNETAQQNKEFGAEQKKQDLLRIVGILVAIAAALYIISYFKRS